MRYTTPETNVIKVVASPLYRLRKECKFCSILYILLDFSFMMPPYIGWESGLGWFIKNIQTQYRSLSFSLFFFYCVFYLFFCVIFFFLCCLFFFCVCLQMHACVNTWIRELTYPLTRQLPPLLTGMGQSLLWMWKVTTWTKRSLPLTCHVVGTCNNHTDVNSYKTTWNNTNQRLNIFHSLFTQITGKCSLHSSVQTLTCSLSVWDIRDLDDKEMIQIAKWSVLLNNDVPIRFPRSITN